MTRPLLWPARVKAIAQADRSVERLTGRRHIRHRSSTLPLEPHCRRRPVPVIAMAVVLPKAGTNPSRPRFQETMTETETPFARYSLERAITLRWMLRDIKAKRLRFSPLREADLSTLAELGLIEMRDDEPVLTLAGHAALD
jgi:hypothetical protein